METNTWANLKNAVMDLSVEYRLLEPDADKAKAVIGVVSRNLATAEVENMVAQIMLPYLEAYIGQMLGRAAAQLPNREQARTHFDNLLDAEQPHIFQEIRRFYPEGHPELEDLVMQSCERLRSAGYAAIEQEK